MKQKYLYATLVLLVILVGCNKNQTQYASENRDEVKFNSSQIEYMGRIGQTDSTAEIYWSGSSVKIEFEGTSVSATLQDEHGDNYFNVIIDDNSIFVLRPDSIKKTYPLASNLKEGKHSLQLFKRTEWTKGKTSFYGFQFDDAKILNIPPKNKMIEFYGNSITCGYGVEDYSGKDSPDSIFTNNYNSYAAMTARHFDAEYSCISRSGIGVTVSWFPQIMPVMYNLLDPSNPESLWGFSQTTPDIVIINLFQNDSWIVNMPANEQFKNRFGSTRPTKDFIINAYADFVKAIRGKYQEAHIICMLGNMDITKEGSPWPGYVQTAVESFQDKKIHTLFAPYKNTSGHPRVEEQKILADSLIGFIERNNLW